MNIFTGKEYANQLQIEGTIREYENAVRTGAKTLVQGIRTANPKLVQAFDRIDNANKSS